MDNAGGDLCGPVPPEVGEDRLPPPAPSAFQVEPEGWTNVNEFTVKFEEPWDASGIAAVWYKSETPPSAPDDGQDIALNGGENRFTLASREGEQPLCLWLEDKAGNKSHLNRAQGTLRLDQTPPIGQILINKGAETTDCGSVRLSLAAQDRAGGRAGSGVSQVRLSDDGEEWTDWIEWQPFKINTMSWDWLLLWRTGEGVVWTQFADTVGAVWVWRVGLQRFVCVGRSLGHLYPR